MKKKLRLFLLPHRILFCKRGHKPILHMHLLLILLCLAAVLPSGQGGGRSHERCGGRKPGHKGVMDLIEE